MGVSFFSAEIPRQAAPGITARRLKGRTKELIIREGLALGQEMQFLITASAVCQEEWRQVFKYPWNKTKGAVIIHSCPS